MTAISRRGRVGGDSEFHLSPAGIGTTDFVDLFWVDKR